MTPEEIEAIIGGYHGDPFRILGPHAVRKRGGQPRWEVRAFLPQAESATLRLGDQLHPMEKIHDQGFFCTSLPGSPGKYLVQAKLFNGPTIEFEDPYRFGPIITDYELHLHTEGTHYEAYRMLGAHIAEADGVKGVRFAVWARGVTRPSHLQQVLDGRDSLRHDKNSPRLATPAATGNLEWGRVAQP
jgi:1,4-alpha-glucan branching enzyme